MLCDLDNFVQIFDGFNQLVQIPFGFALGLAFSQTNITVGWIVFWIIVWELGVYLLFCNTRYYDPIFRISYNCVFLISILVGQYIYFGKTTFQNFLYPSSITEKNFVGEKLQIMDKVEVYFENLIENEDIKSRKQKLNDKYTYYLS